MRGMNRKAHLTDTVSTRHQIRQRRHRTELLRRLTGRSRADGATRIVVARDNADAIHEINRGIAFVDNLARRTNPDATPPPRVTEMVAVYDLDFQAFHCIHLHRLDYRAWGAPAVGKVVVFSDPAFAPCRTDKIQLATSGFYREQEDLEPGIRDRHDGTLTRDGTPWASSVMGGTVRARLSFNSSPEPWVYCASRYRFDSELRRLRSEFEGKFGYSAATRILDADAFAARLGVEFALGLDKSVDVELGPIDEFGYARSSYTTNLWDGSRPIDSVVHVYYGPVNYEDVSGRVDKQAHWFDPNAGPMAWFTKKSSFAKQNEYRFAVSTPGTPVRQRHYIEVSPELRALCCAV